MHQVHIIDRRQFLTGALGAACAGIVPHSASAQQKRVIWSLGWLPTVEYAGHWAANALGYFSNEAIDPVFLPGGPNAPDNLLRVVAGRADLTSTSWLPLLDALERGADLVILGCQWHTSPGALISLPDAPIRTPEDLVGKRLLLQFESDRFMIDAILALSNLPQRYETRPAGFTADPLFAGKGDAFLAFATNQPVALERKGLVAGRDFHVTLLSDLGYRVSTGLIVCPRRDLDSAPDRITRYLHALHKGWRYALEHPIETVDMVMEAHGADLGLERAQQIRQMELQDPLIRRPELADVLSVDHGLLDGTMRTIAQMAGRTVPSIEHLFDPRPLHDASRSI